MGKAWACHYEPESKRQLMEWEDTGSPVRKKLWVQLIVFWDIKEPITIDFLEKGTTVSSFYFCQLFKQSWPYLFNDLHVQDVLLLSSDV